MPVEVNESVMNQIKYLCSLIPDKEWSGILFYITEGSIKKIDTFKIIPVDIYLMDIGTSGSTEYETDETIIAHRMQNKHLLDPKIKIGHIHSHNNMGSFFSGVDDDELIINSECHNYYFSLVVNNRMEIVGKIAQRMHVSYTNTAKDEEGESYVLEMETDDLVAFTNCKINKHIPKLNKSFMDRVKNIIDISKKRIKDFNNAAGFMRNNWENEPYDQHNYGHYMGPPKNNLPANTPKNVATSGYPKSKTFKEIADSKTNYTQRFVQKEFPEINVVDTEDATLGEMLTEVLAINVLLCNNHNVQTSTFEDACKFVGLTVFKSKYDSQLSKQYALDVISVFDESYKEVITSEIPMEELMDDIESIIDLMEEYKERYIFLKDIIEALNKLLSSIVLPTT